MGLMSDTEISEAIASKKLVVEQFDPVCLGPATYDMRLGEEAITSSVREKINPKNKGLLIIASGDFALITTQERVKMPNDMAGHLGLRSSYAKKGLVLLSGPQIDPGYHGVLVIGLSNLSPRDIVIPYNDPVCTVEFYSLDQPVAKPYAGEHQGQMGILAKDLQNLVEAQGMTFGQVIKTLSELSQNVKSLSDSVNFLKWFFPIAMSLFTIILAAFTLVINIFIR